jgi:hypothetical protein
MNKKGSGGFIIYAILIFLVIVVSIFATYYSVDNVTITIKDKERIHDGMSSYYLIFTDSEVFKNEDNILFWKFDSSDVYNKLEVGHTYNVDVNWFRIPFLSAYRNIIKIN